MSVASKNLFAVLEDDASDSQIVPPSEKPSTPPPTTLPTKAQNNKEQKVRGPASRGGRYYQRGGKASTVAAATDAPDENEALQKRSDSEAPRGRGRGRGGRGGGRGAIPRRGREFDRQSGTLPVSEKRVHQGWGGDNGERELRNEVQAVADASAEVANTSNLNDWSAETPSAAATAEAASGDWAGTGEVAQNDGGWDAPAVSSGWDAPQTTEGGDAATTGRGEENRDNSGRRRRNQEEEEEDNTLTLDQYLAKQKDASVAAVPKLEGVRQANEGTDDSLWKNAIQVDKSSDDAYFMGKAKAAPKAKAKKQEKETIEIDAHFDRPSRGVPRGRGRGGEDRRGGRGGRGRGGDRNQTRQFSGRGQGNNLDVDDQSAFPSLS